MSHCARGFLFCSTQAKKKWFRRHSDSLFCDLSCDAEERSRRLLTTSVLFAKEPKCTLMGEDVEKRFRRRKRKWRLQHLSLSLVAFAMSQRNELKSVKFEMGCRCFFSLCVAILLRQHIMRIGRNIKKKWNGELARQYYYFVQECREHLSVHLFRSLVFCWFSSLNDWIWMWSLDVFFFFNLFGAAIYTRTHGCVSLSFRWLARMPHSNPCKWIPTLAIFNYCLLFTFSVVHFRCCRRRCCCCCWPIVFIFVVYFICAW